jgi:hypothetical protein
MLTAHHTGDLKTVVSLQSETDAIYKIILQHNSITAGRKMRILGDSDQSKPLKGFRKQLPNASTKITDYFLPS